MIRRIVRLLSMGMVLSFLTPFLSTSQAAKVTLSVGDGSGSPGSSEHQVAVDLENPNDGVKGIQMDVCDGDDYLVCTACDTTERTSGFSCSINNDEDGCCRVILISLSGGLIEAGTGPVFTLTYNVSEEAPEGQCRELTPESVKVSDESGNPFPSSEVVAEAGEFCFVTSSSTTTVITTTTTTIPHNGVSVEVWPDQLWKSRWIPLPYLLVMTGEGTHFNVFTSREYEPEGVLFPLLPLVWSEGYIWDIVLVMPNWLSEGENQTVTVTVSTGDEVAEDDFEVKLLPFILEQERSLK